MKLVWVAKAFPQELNKNLLLLILAPEYTPQLITIIVMLYASPNDTFTWSRRLRPCKAYSHAHERKQAHSQALSIYIH